MTFITNLFGGGWTSIVTSILTALSKAFAAAVTGIFKGIEQAMIATTTPHLRNSTWFHQVFHSVMIPAFVISMVVLMCAIAEAVLRGEPHEVIRRAFVAPVVVGVAMTAATTIGGAAVGAVNTLSKGVLAASLGHTAAPAGLEAIVTAVLSTSIDPIVGIVLAIAALIALVAVWIELVLRGVLIYLVFAMVPLAVAGVFWRHTQAWLRRIIDVAVALLLTQLIIFTVFAIGIDAITHLSTGWSAAPLGLGTLLLAAFAMPIALRLAPHTTTAVGNFGRALGHVKQAAQSVGQAGAAAASGGAAAPALVGATAAGGAGLGGVGSVVEGAGVTATGAGLDMATAGANGAVGAKETGDPVTGPGEGDDLAAATTGEPVPSGAPDASTPTMGPTPGTLSGADAGSTGPPPTPTSAVPGTATATVGPVPGTHPADMRAATAARAAKATPPTPAERRKAALAHGVSTLARTGHAPSAVAGAAAHYVASRPSERKSRPPVALPLTTTSAGEAPDGTVSQPSTPSTKEPR